MIQPYEYELVDNGTLDTVIRVSYTMSIEMAFSPEIASEYRDPDTGELNFDEFIAEVVEPTVDDLDWYDEFTGL